MRVALANRALDRIGSQRETGIERRLREGGDRSADAGGAESTVALAEGDGGRGFDGTILYLESASDGMPVNCRG